MNLKKQPSSFRDGKQFGLTQYVMSFLKKRSKAEAALDKIPMPIPASMDDDLFAVDVDLGSLYKEANSKGTYAHTWSERNTPLTIFLSDMRFLYSTDKGHDSIEFNSLTVPELCVKSGSVELHEIYRTPVKKFIIPYSCIYLHRDKAFQMSLLYKQKHLDNNTRIA